MARATPEELNALTKNFYETCARHWNNSPEYEWAGWGSLREYLPTERFDVLDLGCGSGRFGHFLEREYGRQVTAYVGVDYADFYVETARRQPVDFIRSFAILQKDLFQDNWELPASDLVVAFGLIHHLPSEFRPHFFRQLRSVFGPRTLGIVTTWQYLDNPRLRKKILPEHPLHTGGADNVLSWTQGTYGERYSHHWSVEEVLREFAGYGFEAEYLPGPSEAERGLNNYFLVRRL